jgi:hypothetical protein
LMRGMVRLSKFSQNGTCTECRELNAQILPSEHFVAS